VRVLVLEAARSDGDLISGTPTSHLKKAAIRIRRCIDVVEGGCRSPTSRVRDLIFGTRRRCATNIEAFKRRRR
jgi:hypothetical protein